MQILFFNCVKKVPKALNWIILLELKMIEIAVYQNKANREEVLKGKKQNRYLIIFKIV